jgi:hypothetical protein
VYGHGEGEARHPARLLGPQQRLVLSLIQHGDGIVERVPVLEAKGRRVALSQSTHRIIVRLKNVEGRDCPFRIGPWALMACPTGYDGWRSHQYCTHLLPSEQCDVHALHARAIPRQAHSHPCSTGLNRHHEGHVIPRLQRPPPAARCTHARKNGGTNGSMDQNTRSIPMRSSKIDCTRLYLHDNSPTRRCRLHPCPPAGTS